MRRFSTSNYLLSQLLVLGTGVSLTLIAMFWAAQGEQVRREYEFRRQTRNLTTALERTTNRYADLLLSIGDLYHGVTPEAVSAETFRKFVQRSIQSYPGIQALEWAPLVLDQDRSHYEKKLRDMAQQSSLAITERDPQGNLHIAKLRPFYVPVTYLEPLQYNEAALGYDLASESTRFAALQQAMRTGLPTATGRLRLVQETISAQYSFLLFVPIYKATALSQSQDTDSPFSAPRSDRLLTPSVTANSSIAAENSNLDRDKPLQSLEDNSRIHGYVVGVFRLAEVLETSLKDFNHNLSFYVLDQTAYRPEQMLGFYDVTQRKLKIPTVEVLDLNHDLKLQCPILERCQQSFQVGQRTWQLIFIPPPHPLIAWNVWAVGAIGFLITCIVWVVIAHWQKELQQTRAMSDLKMRLFSMTSHELRTPLSVITLSSQSLLLQGDLLTPHEQKRRIGRIQDSAQRLGQLVGDLLILARAEAGKLEIDRSIVNLKLLLEKLLDAIPLKSGQHIQVEGIDNIPLVYTDAKILTSILTNLIANASKYSAEDSPIHITLSPQNQWLHIQIQDQGIGIPAAEQAQVTESFYRATNTGKIPGTGLGLAVVKTCVEHLQGELDIISNPSQGTCITVTLPCLD